MKNHARLRQLLAIIVIFCESHRTGLAQESKQTPRSLRLALAATPTDKGAADLAVQIREWFGKDKLAKGDTVKTDQLDVAFAVEIAGIKTAPKVVSEDGVKLNLPLTRVGSTDVYAVGATFADGAGMKWMFEVDGKKFGGGPIEVYKTHPDAVEQPGVPKGKVTQMPKWESKIFAGTTRDWWVYVPAQYKPEEPACVMVFQDGGGMKNYCVPVLDNLIAKKEIPVIVAVFINPGDFADKKPNRSYEYDRLSDQYVRFILEEMLPEVEKTVKLKHDPASRAISGLSSGGICSFTAAWERPGEFSKVLSFIGSFTDIQSGPTKIEGGHNYPALIRKTDKKPIRVFLQDGENDLDNEHGNWPLANQQMAKALAFKGYDYKFVYGQGFHSDKHARAILPDALRWLWRAE